ncbi:MAG: YdcF family protein [Pseudomonadota bacterium]|nr:MAG: YdcF family protein [Pseudomonadota bacterium]
MDIYLTRIIEAALLPPGILILLFLLGTLLLGHFHRTGTLLLISGFALLVVFSMPVVGHHLLHLLETDPPVSNLDLSAPAAQAIVILGNGRYRDAPEYRQDTVSRGSLERLRYGARLHRQTALPVMVCGGAVFGEDVPEATLMRAALNESFGVATQWEEGASRTTWENAKFASVILREAGVERILLVTHAWHMPRARGAFEALGMQVVAAPLGYRGMPGQQPIVIGMLPSASGLHATRLAMRELLGRWWYQLVYYDQVQQDTEVAQLREPAAQ